MRVKRPKQPNVGLATKRRLRLADLSGTLTDVPSEAAIDLRLAAALAINGRPAETRYWGCAKPSNTRSESRSSYNNRRRLPKIVQSFAN
jgi:hypothetical protein